MPDQHTCNEHTQHDGRKQGSKRDELFLVEAEDVPHNECEKGSAVHSEQRITRVLIDRYHRAFHHRRPGGLQLCTGGSLQRKLCACAGLEVGCGFQGD